MKKILLLLIIFPLYLFAWQMEADTVTVNRTLSGTTHINFRKTFTTTPVVFTLMNTKASGSSASLRITNISTSGFDIYTVEPDGDNGRHRTLKNIPYIAIEEGSHTLPNGKTIIAGKINTTSFQGKFIPGNSYQSVSISGVSNPAIIGQIQTRNNERTDLTVPNNPSQPWMTTTINNISNSSFNIALDRSETSTGSVIQNETIAYLVMDGNINGGNNYFASSEYKKIEFETIITPTVIFGLDDGFKQFSYSKTYDDPVVVATKNSRYGVDGGWLRSGVISTSDVTLTIDEDTASDSERNHPGKENASIILFSEPFDVDFNAPSNSANIIINEVMYRESGSGTNNTEFIEFYAKSAGELRGYIVSDQDGHKYIFPSKSISSGDYIILHTASGTNSSSGNIHHFYMSSSPIWNNTGDDVFLLKPSNDDVTILSDGDVINSFPYDFIEYDGGNSDPIPTSMNGVTLSWSSTYDNELSGVARDESISLTPNGVDSNKAACWERTSSGNASNNSCSNYQPTVSTDGSGNINSQTKNNNLSAQMSILKTSIILSDGISSSNPKRIPGAVIRYCFDIRNVGAANADNVAISDTLPTNIGYVKAGQVIQDISVNCNCNSISDSSGTATGQDVSVSIGTITGTSNTSTAKSCAYIEATIN